MDTFISLNKSKLKFAFSATSLILLGLVSVILIIAYFSNGQPGIELLMTILLTAGVGFPIFIVLIAYLTWLYRRSLRRKLFAKAPFNQLENIGFSKSYLNIDTKWHFTEEIKEKIINSVTYNDQQRQTVNYLHKSRMNHSSTFNIV